MGQTTPSGLQQAPAEPVQVSQQAAMGQATAVGGQQPPAEAVEVPQQADMEQATPGLQQPPASGEEDENNSTEKGYWLWLPECVLNAPTGIFIEVPLPMPPPVPKKTPQPPLEPPPSRLYLESEHPLPTGEVLARCLAADAERHRSSQEEEEQIGKRQRVE